MKAIDRLVQAISIEAIAVPNVGDRLELRIRGDGPQGDQPTILTRKEARLLAFSLLADAERLGSN